MSLGGAKPQPSTHCPQTPWSLLGSPHWPCRPVRHPWPLRVHTSGSVAAGGRRHLLLIGRDAPGPSPHTCPRSPGCPTHEHLGCRHCPGTRARLPPSGWAWEAPSEAGQTFNWVERLSAQHPIGIGALGAPGTGQQKATSSLGTPSGHGDLP